MIAYCTRAVPSLAESLLLIMSHVIRNNATNAALQSVLKLVHYHLRLGTPFTASKYLFMKNFKDTSTFECHAYCPTCQTYIGTTDVRCELCKETVSHDVCVEGGHYFLKFCLKDQMTDLLENHDVSRHLQVGEKRADSDIHQGRRYRDLPLGENDISVTFSTDGVPIHRTGSKFSIHPVMYMVNELPYAIRRKKIALACLWFGKKNL